MNIAVVLVHNKGDQGNTDQIETVKLQTKRVTDTHDSFDEQGNSVGTFDTYHYEISTLSIPHEARFYQVVPFGVTPPSNFNAIDSHNVLYARGDEDKTGDHPRFFNWGLKRATDYGADIVIHVEDHKKLDFKQLEKDLNKLADKSDPTEFVDGPSCKVATLKLLLTTGLLDESKGKSEAVTELKGKLNGQGGKSG